MYFVRCRKCRTRLRVPSQLYPNRSLDQERDALLLQCEGCKKLFAYTPAEIAETTGEAEEEAREAHLCSLPERRPRAQQARQRWRR
jgi:flavoprotein